MKLSLETASGSRISVKKDVVSRMNQPRNHVEIQLDKNSILSPALIHLDDDELNALIDILRA